MLTGVRPHYDAGVPAIDPEAKLRLAAERFDASARDRLVDFFDKALHRDAEQRFESANKMRKAWNLCFEAEALSVAPSVVAVTAVTPSDLPPADELTDEQLRALDPSTPLGALPLSTRARNALDRAGVVQAKDLLAIADNRLSAMRGVGSKVGKEILEFRRRWVAAREVETPDVTPFFPEYRGADLMVALAGLEPVMADALSDAGLHTLGAVAAAPSDQIRAVAKRARFKVAALQEALAEEQSKQDDEDIPLSLERWLEILLPRRHKQNKYLYALFGLDDPFLGRLDVRNRDVADHFGVTSAAVSIALGNARTRWRKRSNVRDLVDATRAVLEAAEGAVPIGKMAEELMSRWPHGRPGRTPLHLARAAAIVRIACELQRETPNGMRIVRLHEDAPWVLGQDGLIEVVRQLGREADKLAARDILASPGEVRRVLSARVDGTRLDRLSHEQLTDLASAASKTAARSPRLELYPRGMPATRALELSAAVLTGRLEPVHVIFRVASRYPAAERLPDRPELDQLLLPHGFSFASQTGYYERAGERADQNTHLATSTSYSPASVPGAQLAPDAKTVARRDFDDRIKSALERRSLRVLGVTADRAEEAALALRDQFDLELVDLDRRMLGAIREEMKALNIPDERVLHDADREGPAGKAWNNLRTVVTRAADSFAASLLPATKPLLLVQPGLLARYQLEAFVAALVDASKDDACAAIFLLVPAHDTGGIPKINGEMVVRGILPSQGMWVPRAWLRAAGERVA